MGSNLPYTASVVFHHCPYCGQKAFTSGLQCGFGTITGCLNNRSPVEVLPASLQASIALEDSNPTDKLRHELQVLVSAYTEQIDRLTEELEYERLKSTAYAKVYSAQQYILAGRRLGTSWYATYCLLGKALAELNKERADCLAIRAKYSQPVMGQYSDKQFVATPSVKQRIVDYYNDKAKSHEDSPEEGV